MSEREAFRKWAADEERRAKIAEARDEASSDPRAQQRAMLRRIKCELAELNGTVQAPRERAVVRHIEADRVTWGAGEY